MRLPDAPSSRRGGIGGSAPIGTRSQASGAWRVPRVLAPSRPLATARKIAGSWQLRVPGGLDDYTVPANRTMALGSAVEDHLFGSPGQLDHVTAVLPYGVAMHFHIDGQSMSATRGLHFDTLVIGSDAQIDQDFQIPFSTSFQLMLENATGNDISGCFAFATGRFT